MNRRVVVTGLGVLTANADGVESFLTALRLGTSGIGEITQFDASQYSCKIAGEINSLPLDSGADEQLDRASLLSLMCAKQALEDAGVDSAKLRPGALGVCFGTTCGGVQSLEKVSEVLDGEGDNSQIPSWRVSEMSFFAATNHVARLVGATGPVLTPVVACASGSHAIGMGSDFVRAGRADVMVVGGVDVISRFIFRGFNALNGLGTSPYRAFDKNRKGVVLGEGVAVLVLEELAHAQARGARIYGEILGHSFNNDGCHIVNPNPTGEGIARSFRAALADAGIKPEDVDHLNAHGTGTIANDTAETAGVKLAFGERAHDLLVASIKPMIGHTSGAAGAIELISSIASLQEGYVPPTINFETPDPDCDLNVSVSLRESPLDIVVSSNSGFGGSNAAVVVSSGKRAARRLESPNDRVVITGLGAFLPSVETKEAFWEELRESRLGSNALHVEPGEGREIEAFDFFKKSGLAPTKDTRRMDRFSQISSMGGLFALRDAGFPYQEEGEELGLVHGSAYACLESNEKYSSSLSKARVNPVVYQNTVSNAVSGYMSILMNIRGPVSVLNQGWLAGSAALAYGYELVRSGRCSAVLAGGAERQCRMTRLSLERAGALSKDGYCLPLDPQGSGTVLCDGSAFLMLESLTSARKRGARIYAELAGYGFSSAAACSPEEAVANATKQALEALPRAKRGLNIFGSAAGLADNDLLEWKGLELALSAQDIYATLTGVKGAVGETLGAGGPLSLIGALLAKEHGEVPGGLLGTAKTSTFLKIVDSLRQSVLDSQLISCTDLDGSCVVLAISALNAE